MTEQDFGRYRLVALLGRGGMGEVWRAVDTDKDREVALKVLGSWLNGDPQFAQRFRRESALAARLNSPHIVPIHDYGQIDGRLYIDMPLIDGTDLAGLLEHGPLPPARAVRTVEQVSRALDVAHRAGLVHRDVKPSNILICPGSDDHTYLIDFGIAKALDGSRLSLTGSAIGTPAYMAPECFAGTGDARSDVYSLGCVLYEALTGRPPFRAPHLAAYAVVHEREPVPRPSATHAWVPVAMDAVVAQALAKAPGDRYPTAVALSAAVRTALSDVPVSRATRLTPTLVTPDPAPLPDGGPVPTRRPLPSTAVASDTSSALATRGWWRRLFAPAPRRQTMNLGSPVLALAVAEVHGRVLTLAVGRTVRIWDLATGSCFGDLPARPGEQVAALTTTQIDGRAVAVVANNSWDHPLRMWDLTNGTALDDLRLGSSELGSSGVNNLAVAHLDGRATAVAGRGDGTFVLVDLVTGQPVGTIGARPVDGLRRPGHAVDAIATTTLDGQAVAVTLGSDGTVRTWDLFARKEVRPPLAVGAGRAPSLAVVELRGHLVAITCANTPAVRAWDLVTGLQVGERLLEKSNRGAGGVREDRSATVVATTHLEGRPIAVIGDDLGRMEMWDLATDRRLGRKLFSTAFGERLTCIAIAQVEGRPVAVSATGPTVRAWDLLAAVGK